MRILKLLSLLMVILISSVEGDQEKKDLIISSINFIGLDRTDARTTNKYRNLIIVKTGDQLNFNKIRKSITILFRTGDFSNITARRGEVLKERVPVYFYLEKKPFIKSIKISSSKGLSRKKIRNSIFSVREASLFDSHSLKKAELEILDHLRSQGYFKGTVDTQIEKNGKGGNISILFSVKGGLRTSLESIKLITSKKSLKDRLKKELQYKHYSPLRVNRIVEKIKNILRKQKYFFPNIKVKENFRNNDTSKVSVEISVDPGYKYIFRFIGIGNKRGLVEPIWQKDVYEKWAERESKARISADLKSRGYLKAEVKSSVEIKNSTKIITFIVKKYRKFSLGEIKLQGNSSFSNKNLLKYFTTKNNIFDKLFWLRPMSIQNDINLLRLFYYDRGFPKSVIKMSPSFRQKKADINVNIKEGPKHIIKSIKFLKNRYIKEQILLKLISGKVGSPFSQLRLNKDINELRNFYISRGFKDISISMSISSGTEKDIQFLIDEGKPFKRGRIVVMGASRSQESLLRSRFPFPEGEPFNINKIEEYRDEISKQSVFTEIKILNIEKPGNIIDLLIKVIQDKSVFYGAGVGWEERRGLRGTFEYQKRNIFSTTSTLSAIAQLGFNEQRGALTLDTPFFLRSRFLSSARVWKEYEIYPSYRFERVGFGETLTYQVDPNTFTAASLRWYTTELTELKIEESGLDIVNKPFRTLALNLAYNSDNRDDPFNASRGDFFSTNLKIGVPFISSATKFIKFTWNYQQNTRIFRNGVFSYSLRNGFAWGDMSITERFFAGGIRTFRGVKNDRLGPISETTNNPVGGKAMLLINFEATFPIHFIPVEDFYYTIFTDFGNVFKDPLQFKLQSLKWCAGLSLKYKTPIGPVRLDFAWNLKKVAADDFVIQIGIGNVF